MEAVDNVNDMKIKLEKIRKVLIRWLTKIVITEGKLNDNAAAIKPSPPAYDTKGRGSSTRHD
jgi:hypothetical protein